MLFFLSYALIALLKIAYKAFIWKKLKKEKKGVFNRAFFI
ncbi:hypothetical protein BMWSH_1328 [Priestia megaterium WSH-002]|uniref:Uncharacterized protein n=1 Tax=Priestia megaterium (strain WSH-002) TaxID=1006007 RepID=A0A8D3WY15_PRIMW|nr:hypothetical protein BMWSH_1328 [Priestia megaterium WSH-002]